MALSGISQSLSASRTALPSPVLQHTSEKLKAKIVVRLGSWVGAASDQNYRVVSLIHSVLPPASFYDQ